MYDIKKNYDIARKLASQGMILLKNEEQVLPLHASDKVGVIECADSGWSSWN